jgi:capsid protein
MRESLNYKMVRAVEVTKRRRWAVERWMKDRGLTALTRDQMRECARHYDISTTIVQDAVAAIRGGR